MQSKPTPIALAVALAMLGSALPVFAAEAKTDDAIQVTGIRASKQKSMSQKRKANSVVEVITAEDVGKMPDKNVADSLRRVPGITTASSAGGEGGFDENDRVSLRGTNPSLTQTTLNGHTVGTGDWFILAQTATGRSVSYSLLPSELVGRITVHKSAQADLTEGGIAGSVDVETRKPLDQAKKFMAEGSVQGVYSDLAEKWKPQLSGLISWKNDSNTFGVLAQAFSETRALRRDGQEFLGYTAIDPKSPAAKKHTELAGAMIPTLIGSSLFEQERKRKGGLLTLSVKPSSDLGFDLSLFTSDMKAKNYNRNYMAWVGNQFNKVAPDWAPNKGEYIGAIPTSYTLVNGTVTAAAFDKNDLASIVVDNIYRPGSAASTNYVNLDGKWRATDALTITAQVGTTKGIGDTKKEVAFEGESKAAMSYVMHGTSSPATVRFPNFNTSDYSQVTPGWGWGSVIKTTDQEHYAQADGLFKFSDGIVESIKFGSRLAKHKNKIEWPLADRPKASFDWKTTPSWNGQTYPGNFGSDLGSGVPANVWQLDPSAIEAWAAAQFRVATDPSTAATRHNWTGEYDLREKTAAVYAMANLAGDAWSGNIGLRYVKTNTDVLVNKSGGANPITGSDWGSYTPTNFENNYNDVLPSANFKYEVSKDIVIRAAAAKTMSRPNYSSLGGAISTDDLTHTGNGGNPKLKPVRSTNFDAGVEWYFAPKSIISVGTYYLNLTSYISHGVAAQQLYNDKTGKVETFNITGPLNTTGKVKGFEVAYEQPIGQGFGINGNFTYANASAGNGKDLEGASKNTYNLGAFFENDAFNIRASYSYRSSYYNGIIEGWDMHTSGVGSLAASASYNINDNLTLTFEGMNLNNPTLKAFGANETQPRSFYSNGRQYYLGLRAKF